MTDFIERIKTLPCRLYINDQGVEFISPRYVVSSDEISFKWAMKHSLPPQKVYEGEVRYGDLLIFGPYNDATKATVNELFPFKIDLQWDVAELNNEMAPEDVFGFINRHQFRGFGPVWLTYDGDLKHMRGREYYKVFHFRDEGAAVFARTFFDELNKQEVHY